MKQKPSPHVVWSWLSVLLLTALPLSLLLGWVLTRYPVIPAGATAILWGGCLILIGGAYLPLRWRCMSFSLEEDRLSVTGGVWFHTTRRMHRDAVRQVTLLEGPIERLCHTAFLLVRSTGGFILIEGIDRDTADSWCRQLCHR